MITLILSPFSDSVVLQQCSSTHGHYSITTVDYAPLRPPRPVTQSVTVGIFLQIGAITSTTSCSIPLFYINDDMSSKLATARCCRNLIVRPLKLTVPHEAIVRVPDYLLYAGRITYAAASTYFARRYGRRFLRNIIRIRIRISVWCFTQLDPVRSCSGVLAGVLGVLVWQGGGGGGQARGAVWSARLARQEYQVGTSMYCTPAKKFNPGHPRYGNMVDFSFIVSLYVSDLPNVTISMYCRRGVSSYSRLVWPALALRVRVRVRYRTRGLVA